MGCKSSKVVVEVDTEKGVKSINTKHSANLNSKLFPYVLRNPVVNAERTAIIRGCWNSILAGTDAYDPKVHSTPLVFFYETFYFRLFQVIPDSRKLFKSSIKLQGKALVGMITNLGNLFADGNVEETLAHLAKRHVAYGVNAQYFSECGLVMFYALEVCAGSIWTAEMKESWIHLYSFLLQVVYPYFEKATIPATIESYIEAKIVSISKFGSESVHVVLHLAKKLDYFPGESILLGCPAEDNGTHHLRYYTIINPISNNAKVHEIHIIVRNCGFVSNWFNTVATPNAIVRAERIGGKIGLDLAALNPKHDKDSFFLFSAGSGITVSLSLICALAQWQHCEGITVKMHHTCRHEEDASAIIQIFEEYTKHLKNKFQLILSLTSKKENSQWNGKVGRITKEDIVSLITPNYQPTANSYICGPHEFNVMVKKVLEDDIKISYGKIGVYEFNTQHL